jgi:hypothetical protein
MGLTVSKADGAAKGAGSAALDTAPPPLPSFSVTAASAVADQLKSEAREERVNYLDLPAPVRYEDLQVRRHRSPSPCSQHRHPSRL